jgi:hypothetical protein
MLMGVHVGPKYIVVTPKRNLQSVKKCAQTVHGGATMTVRESSPSLKNKS